MSLENLKISCPKCKWEPEKHSLWQCTCGNIWNTFDTGGRCIPCGIQWEDTQCLCCKKWSPHIDWYHIDINGVVEKCSKIAEKTQEEGKTSD